MLTPNKHNTSNRKGWYIGGGIGLSAAAAFAGLAIIPNLGDTESVQTPSNSVLPTVPDSTPPAPTNTEEPRPTLPPLALRASTVVAASPAGISINGEIISAEPQAEVAIGGPGGGIWYTLVGDERVHLLNTATDEVTVFDVPLDDGHSIDLLDVETVRGELTLLYSTTYRETCLGAGDPDCTTMLRTFQPGSGAEQTVAEQSAWESKWGPFQLAESGLIFGSSESAIGVDANLFNIESGTTPSAESFGLNALTAECADCPRAFTIDPVGQHVAWFEGSPGDWRIVVIDVATGDRAEILITGLDIPPIGVHMHIGVIEMVEGGVTSGQAVISSTERPAPIPYAASIDLAEGSATEIPTDPVITLN